MGLIVDPNGQPLDASPLAEKSAPAVTTLTDNMTATMGAAPYRFPYEAVAWLTQEMGNWLPDSQP